MGFFHTIFLFDGFRSVRASLFGNTLRGGAPAGAENGFPRQCEHWLGMTPLRGVRGGQGRPPLRSNARGAVQNRNLGIAFWRGTWYNGGKEYRERSFLYVGYF